MFEPDWLRRATPPEPVPARPLAPSRLGGDQDEEAGEVPPSEAMRDAARRGAAMHRLFELLPALPADERRATAEAWLARTQPGLAADDVLGPVFAILDAPAYADLFGPDARAETPFAARLGDQVVAGKLDRLLVTGTRVVLVDFKTGRRVPARAADAPVAHLRQMAAYAAALGRMYPDRAVEAALLYTAGPALLPLPPALLAAHAPGA